MPSEKEKAAAARAICDRGIRALDGTQATWERHAADFLAMADAALSAAEKEREGETFVQCDSCGAMRVSREATYNDAIRDMRRFLDDIEEQSTGEGK